MTKQQGMKQAISPVCALALVVALHASIAAAQRPARPRSRPGAAKIAATQKPQYKGIFEPVSYSEDLNLSSVFFVNEETGWVSGAAGTILHTRDGGQTWTAQMGGDPQGQEAQIDDLYFLDASTGWAVGAAENTVQRKLLGTRDGQTWRQVGTMGTQLGSYSDYVFTSTTNGLFIEGRTANVSAIYQTRDGGRNWEPVLPQCKAKVRIAGLNKDLTCQLKDLFFLTPTLGWAAGAGAAGTVFVLRTQDGGATWEYLFVEPNLGHPDENHFNQKILFIDESNGFLLVPRADKLLMTSDGGKTWEAAPIAAEDSAIHFADPEVGWMYGDSKLLFTVNGGKSWASRAIRFPADVNGFSLPTRRRGYVVGQSGMVFRYQVVEASYENAEGIPAPVMPGFESALDDHVAALQQQLQSLEQTIEQKTGQQIEITAAAEAEASERAPEAASNDAEAGPGLVEQVAADQLTQIENTVTSLNAEVPRFSGRFRNLNLVFTGLQMVGQLFGQAQGLKDSVTQLRQARDLASVSAALGQLTGQAQGMVQSTRSAFQTPQP
ncbi:MAG: YCF48-related protein [Candidatus Acidiferrales bacterium]